MTLIGRFKRPGTPIVLPPEKSPLIGLSLHQKGICEAIWRCYQAEGLDYTRTNLKMFSNDEERREAIARFVRACPSEKRCTIIERELFLRGPLKYGYAHRWSYEEVNSSDYPAMTYHG